MIRASADIAAADGGSRNLERLKAGGRNLRRRSESLLVVESIVEKQLAHTVSELSKYCRPVYTGAKYLNVFANSVAQCDITKRGPSE